MNSTCARSRKTLNRLGYYQPYEQTGITGIPDAGVFAALKSFQKDQGLRPTGTAKPGDDTVKALNREFDNKKSGKYIWRTVGDGRVRKSHAELDGTLRDFSDSPDPGEEFNCRCWVEPVDENVYTDAISPTMGLFDILLGGLIAKGGLRIGLPILRILQDIIRRSPQLNVRQLENLARFVKKIPSNAKGSIETTRLPKGNVKLTATSPGKVPGSKAVYEKIIDLNGKTIGYTKTTYDQYGNIVHIKNKINGGR